MAAPLDLVRGRYHAFLARDDDDIAAAQTLRATCFGLASPRDTDRFDPEHQHVLIHDLRDARLVCCFRLRVLTAMSCHKAKPRRITPWNGLKRLPVV